METAYTPFVLPKSTTHNLPSTMTNLANHTGSGPSSSPAEHAAWQGSCPQRQANQGTHSAWDREIRAGKSGCSSSRLLSGLRPIVNLLPGLVARAFRDTGSPGNPVTSKDLNIAT